MSIKKGADTLAGISVSDLTRADVVDNLLSEEKDLPLSAKQGNVLSKRDTALTMPRIVGYTEEEINNIYNNFSADMQNQTWYRGLVQHYISHSVLTGGTFYLEGFKLTSEHEWQRVTIYNRDVATFFRAKQRGTWSEWDKIVTKSNMEWKLIGSVTGANSVAIDSELYTDFKVVQSYNGRETDYYLTSNEINGATSTKEKFGGFYQSATECAKTNIYYNGVTKVIGNNHYYFAGTDQIANTTMTVYGKR